MNIMSRIRLYHATLALLAVAAYLTGKPGAIHAWLGYALAGVIIFRLGWALSGNRQVGLTRFYLQFADLKLNNIFTHPAVSKVFMLGIAASLIMATVTGILLDHGQSLLIGNHNVALVSSSENILDANDGNFVKDIHEVAANVLLFFVSMHVTYLLLFKRPLAKFMLFISRIKR